MSDSRQSRRTRDALARVHSGQYLDALLRADGVRAEAVLRNALADGLGAASTFARVVQPALERIGEGWAGGELSVAQEHIATGITKRALAAVYPLVIEDAPAQGPRVVLAGVSGELHSIGLRMISDTLEAAGFESVYLGPDTPAADLVDAVRRHRPALVGISVTMPADLPELRRAIAAVAATDPTVPVMIGGSGVPADLRDHPSYAGDTEAVVATARRLLASGPVLPTVAHPSGGDAPITEPRPMEREFAMTTAQLSDVARAQARRAREYRMLALTDPLTGIPNRRAWDERCTALPEGADVLMLVLDLDGFKGVNDHFGHEAGDAVLERAAAALRSALRTADFAARLGGDEFGVLVRDTGGGGLAVAERIRTAVARELADVGVTTSIGAARHAGDRRATMLAADQALYDAKSQGGNTIRGVQPAAADA